MAYTFDWTLQPYRKALIQAEVAAPDVSQPVDVPFALLRTDGAVGTVSFDLRTRRSRLRLDSGATLAFAMEGVPVALQAVGGGRYIVAFRGMPRNALWQIEWLPAKGSVVSRKVERNGVDYLLFRAAHFDGQLLHWVVYDNRAAKNYLRRYERAGGAWRPLGDDIELPSLEDPAGTHYEMEPPLTLFGDAGRLHIVGGTLGATIEGDRVTPIRFPDCERVLEATRAPSGVAVLCNRKAVDDRGAYSLLTPQAEPVLVSPGEGVPWQLSWNREQQRADVRLAKDAGAYTELLEYDLSRAQNSGLLDFGSDNVEGRVAWSQIYYLNGLMDALYLARHDDRAYELFIPIARKLRLRLELEIRLLDRLLSEGIGIRTRAFTHDRSPALFAVQTSRLLLLFERYRREFPDARPLVNHERLRQQVSRLQGHIEVLAKSGEDERWLPDGQRHLRWPQGSAFYFDGLAVPYNHQNEWAYALFESARTRREAPSTPALEPQREIIRHFIRHLARAQEFPPPERWHYWWGHAFDGYDKASGMSTNTPTYAGDKSLAWISFRTIDLMSVLASLDFLPDLDAGRLRSSAQQKIRDGDVYPFAARMLAEAGAKPALASPIALKYARAGSPWEFANQPWALAILPAAQEAEDPHSTRLNSAVQSRFPTLTGVALSARKSENALLDYLSIALPHNTGQMLKYAGGELGGKYLAWNLAYDLRAALLGYERSGNARFLRLFETAADTVLRVRDDHLGIPDALRGRPAKAWGSNRYSAGKEKWVAWDAFAGMAAYPLARYCSLVSQLRPVQDNRCTGYRAAAEQALAEYDPYWRDDPTSGGGYYFDPYLEDVAPLNHMNTLGLVHVELYRLSSAPWHRSRAEKLARYFRHHWKEKEDGSVEWEYWAGARQDKNRSAAPEDVTHAQINVHFAYECYRTGLVFSRSDMQRLTRTLAENIIRHDGDWASDVGGGGTLTGSGLHEGIGGWAVLADFQPAIRRRINDFVATHPAAYPLGQFSYATGPIAVAQSIGAGGR